MGKTTLLKHIAARKFAIPPHIDILYCEQGRNANQFKFIIKLTFNQAKKLHFLKKSKRTKVRQSKQFFGLTKFGPICWSEKRSWPNNWKPGTFRPDKSCKKWPTSWRTSGQKRRNRGHAGYWLVLGSARKCRKRRWRTSPEGQFF